MSIAKTTAEIDQLRAKAEDYRYELINVLDQLIAVQDQNTKLLKEYTVCYKELLELRDQRKDLRAQLIAFGEWLLEGEYGEDKVERDELYAIIDTHLATIAALKAQR